MHHHLDMKTKIFNHVVASRKDSISKNKLKAVLSERKLGSVKYVFEKKKERIESTPKAKSKNNNSSASGTNEHTISILDNHQGSTGYTIFH